MSDDPKKREAEPDGRDFNQSGDREAKGSDRSVSRGTLPPGDGDRVQLGEWSGDLMEPIGKSQELRELMRDGRAPLSAKASTPTRSAHST